MDIHFKPFDTDRLLIELKTPLFPTEDFLVIISLFCFFR